MGAREFGLMEFPELLFRLQMVDRERAEEDKNRLIAAAYTAWLTGAAGDKKTFQGYLRDLGLMERTALTKKQKETVSGRAHKIAQRIMAMDKPRGKPRRGVIK